MNATTHHNLSSADVEEMISVLERGEFSGGVAGDISPIQQAGSLIRVLSPDPEMSRQVSRLERFVENAERRQRADDVLAQFRMFRDGGRLDLFERLFEARATGSRDPGLSDELRAFHNDLSTAER